MIDEIKAALVNGSFVAVTYAKVSGEIITRIATPWDKIPGADAPQGKREMSEANFRYYEWGADNRFDASAPGDWKSCKVANIKGWEIVSQPD